MNETHLMTLWQAIDQLAQQVPFTREKVEAVLATTLTLQESRLPMDYYESRPILLADGVFLQDVDLRVNRTGETAGFLSLPIGGSCTALSEVHKRYKGLYQTDSPYIYAPDEEYVYTADMPWGALQFGFNHKHRDCLTTVSFNTGPRRKRRTLE